MSRGNEHLAVVISATPASDCLRRLLLEAGIPPAAVTTNIRGLRRSLVLGEINRVSLCITLDAKTLHKHGDPLRTLIQDQRSFTTTLTVIGITGKQPLSTDAAALGCAVYLETLEQVVDAVCYFEHARLPNNPRCTGNWLQPQWMLELDALRVGASSKQTSHHSKNPENTDETGVNLDQTEP